MFNIFLCVGLVIFIGASMFVFNSLWDWNFMAWQDWVIVIVSNIAALVLVAVLLITALLPDWSYRKE